MRTRFAIWYSSTMKSLRRQGRAAAAEAIRGYAGCPENRLVRQHRERGRTAASYALRQPCTSKSARISALRGGRLLDLRDHRRTGQCSTTAQVPPPIHAADATLPAFPTSRGKRDLWPPRQRPVCKSRILSNCVDIRWVEYTGIRTAESCRRQRTLSSASKPAGEILSAAKAHLYEARWARRDSNPQPRDYESPALTIELQALKRT